MSLINKCCFVVVLSFVFLVLSIALVVLLIIFRQAPAPILPELELLGGAEFVVPSMTAETSVINEKPLFWAERAPYIEVVEEVKEEPKPKPVEKNTLKDVKLMGVLGADSASSVIIKDKDDVVRLRVQQEYKGWVLVEVFSESVIFVKSGTSDTDDVQTHEVLMKVREPLPSMWNGKTNLISESK